jgi:hypothetical protein
MFAHQQPAVRYTAGLLSALDAAMSPDVAQRPQTAAQFRELLLGTLPPPSASPGVAMHAVDAATQDLIRRVIDSIDEPVAAAAGPDHHGEAPLHADPAHRSAPIPARKAPPGRWNRALQLVVALALMVTVGFGTVDLQWQPFDLKGASWLPVARLRVPDLSSSATVAAPPTPEPVVTQRAAPVVPALATAAEPAVPGLLIAKTAVESPALKAAPEPTAVKVSASARPLAAGPRQECGARTAFSLYRCMQQQCGLARWQRHPQCAQLEATDSVD